MKKVNKKTLESLIKAGAMDGFGKRAAMLSFLEELIAQSHKLAKQVSSGQTGMFGETQAFAIPDVPEASKEDLLSWEKEFLGFYLSEHPALKTLAKITDLITHEISELNAELHVGKTVKTGGIVSSVRKVMTKKNNEEMAFVTLSSLDGTKLDCVIFPKLYASHGKEDFAENTVLICTGKVDNRDDKLSLIVDTLEKVS